MASANLFMMEPFLHFGAHTEMIFRPPERPFVVRDPVHGYLSVAPHERLVVDAPITQRLRRIGQTGLAEYVFPEAKTSRFVHSLGAMHLASRFLIAALENANPSDVQGFFDDLKAQIDWSILRFEELDELVKHAGALDALSAIRFTGFADMKPEKATENRQLLALVESALRLAALFHDLGHLPFSHDTEFALKDFASAKAKSSSSLPESTLSIANAKAPHEEIGHALAEVVFRLLPERSMAVRSVYSLAKKILDAPEPNYGLFKHDPANALQWLHSLVDGEIDVDRADYLLRDGRALGLDFAQYDLERLVANLVLVKTLDRGYTTAVKEAGLAALESYCLTRSRSHQVFVRHHKVCQVGTALRFACSQFMASPAADPLLQFLSKLQQLGTDTERTTALAQYASLDDGWCFQGLRALQRTSSDRLLSACLGVVLDRDRALKSLWKRKGDLSEDQLATLRARIKEMTSGETGTVTLQEVRRRLLDEGLLFGLFSFKPYAVERETGHSVMRIQSRAGSLVAASEMSPLIRGLQDIWNEDLHLYVFAQVDNPIGIDAVLELMDVRETSAALILHHGHLVVSY